MSEDRKIYLQVADENNDDDEYYDDGDDDGHYNSCVVCYWLSGTSCKIKNLLDFS